jgi:hypothetical protein
VLVVLVVLVLAVAVLQPPMEQTPSSALLLQLAVVEVVNIVGRWQQAEVLVVVRSLTITPPVLVHRDRGMTEVLLIVTRLVVVGVLRLSEEMRQVILTVDTEVLERNLP